ncbi:uncharacterized protein LOC131597971 [Vicia villosa]|uniref:uncharacterized protein LOC131597971 n=1 Tax=Vicia villosa TaxID=3911 RepID=UPI00273C39BB|nr:uncharacterized protein LOC131597971 [Vicia villosa]
MIVGTYKIRGGGSKIKRKRISSIIRGGKADMFLIQETKMKEVSVLLDSSFWEKEDIGFSYSAANGMSGGLLTIWKNYSVTVVASFSGDGYLGNKVLWNGGTYYIANIYSPFSVRAKRILWDRLLELKHIHKDGEWIFGGDFNAVKKRSERVGLSSGGNYVEYREFSEFIDESGLMDVPSKGKKFRWYSGDGKSKSRIDRFLVSNNIEWSDLKIQGRGDFVMKEKLRLIKDRMRWWNKNVFGKYDMEVEEGIRDLNVSDDNELWDEEVHARKRRASKKIWLNLKIKENVLIQKARLK